MVVAASTSRMHHDARKDFFPPTHSHHPSVPIVAYYKAFPHLLAELHSCHTHSATLQGCYNLAHIALRTCIVTCHHLPTVLLHTQTRPHHTHTPHTPHTQTELVPFAAVGFLFLTLFLQCVHVHECTRLCAHTHTHTHTHTLV